MKLDFLKTVDTANNFYGVSLIAENLKEKQLIKKMVSASYIFKTIERQVANLPRRQIVITIEVENSI
jgi:hypothetical protein